MKLVKVGFLCVPEPDEDTQTDIYRLLREKMPEAHVIEEASVQSQRYWIEDILRRWSDESELDLIITIGGTFPAVGPSADEIVPEATSSVLERSLPGISEAMRASVAREDATLAVLDRGVSGIRGRTVIINLPRGTDAATLFLSAIIASLPTIIHHLQDETSVSATEKILSTELSAEDIDNSSMLSQSVKSSRSRDEAKKHALDPNEFAAYLRRNR